MRIGAFEVPDTLKAGISPNALVTWSWLRIIGLRRTRIWFYKPRSDWEWSESGAAFPESHAQGIYLRCPWSRQSGSSSDSIWCAAGSGNTKTQYGASGASDPSPSDIHRHDARHRVAKLVSDSSGSRCFYRATGYLRSVFEIPQANLSFFIRRTGGSLGTLRGRSMLRPITSLCSRNLMDPLSWDAILSR